VFLPASREAAADTPEHTPAVPSRQGQGELVLVVDDEASIREVIRATLESAGYRTLLAADGVNALDIFTRYRREIGLVLSDLEMPELDGAALTRQLRALDPQVRVVLASGIGTREGEAAVQAVAPTAFLPKPLAPRVLLDTLRTILS
jgi:CheY-like chemotaxis protein